MQYKGETRPFELTETGDVYKFPTTHCVFCKHCKDLFWDYTNGPYMFMCDKDCEVNMTEDSCTCECFEDDGYVFDEKKYHERMEARKKVLALARKMLEEDGDLRKELEYRLLNGFAEMLKED